MVTWTTPHVSHATALPVLRALLAAALLAGCTSIEGPTSDVDTWKQSWKHRASAVADGTAAGAAAVGQSLGTAYDGVRSGFAPPDPRAFGPYPDDYATRVKRHLIRFEGIPESASLKFGRPVQSYTNRGILAGGEIDWQGYVVDVEVETERFGGQKRTKAYAVRLRDGEVVEVLDAAYADSLKRMDGSRPASRAD